MGLLKPAVMEIAFLKAAFQGFGGSGKTFTAAELAIGLHKHIKSEKPIAFLDTETGSDYVLHKFKTAGIDVIRHKSRAFVDLLEVTKEASSVSQILLIDSITHFWNELVHAYELKRGKKGLRVWDWKPIKQEWAVFSDLFLMGKLHAIMCGRAGYEYGDRENEETGVMETARTGTKMKVEADFAFEPGLLVEMERFRVPNKSVIGSEYINRAWILKDRFDTINGKCFTEPTFNTFLPHIKLLNIGGDHVAFDATANSEDLFEGPDSRSQWIKRREIAAEEIANELLKRWPGQTADEKKAKLAALEAVFSTGSWTAITSKTAEELEGGLALIREMPIVPEAQPKSKEKN